jgi:acetyl-CoA C-acetyltransferase
MSAEEAKKRGLTPLAKIVAHATHSQAPEWFTTAPVTAIANVLAKAGWDAKDVDLFEVNEAFACVPWRRCASSASRMTSSTSTGGACALGTRSAPPVPA